MRKDSFNRKLAHALSELAHTSLKHQRPKVLLAKWGIPQGYRIWGMSELGQKFCKESVVPAGLLELSFHGAF